MFKTFGVGKLTSDPKLIEVGNTVKVELVLVTEEKYRNGKGELVIDPHFLTFEVWDSAAKYICENAHKGDKIYVEALNRSEQWEKDGVKRSRTLFRITNFAIIPKD